MRAGDPRVSDALASLGTIAREACDLLAEQADTASRLGALASRAMAQLRALGLGDVTQDLLIEEGLRKGAIGGKLSGAGAGGAFYLVLPDQGTARRCLRRLRRFAAANHITLASPLRLLIL